MAARNAKDVDGWTALHMASFNGDAAVVPLLIAAGADVRAKNDDGETPGDLAARRGHPAVAALLRDAVADRDGYQRPSPRAPSRTGSRGSSRVSRTRTWCAIARVSSRTASTLARG